MTVVSGSSRTIRLATELDTALVAVPRTIQYLVLLGTVIVIVLFSLPRVPRQYAELSHLSTRITQPAGYGSDTIAMKPTVYIGLANSSHTSGALGTATVEGVKR